ncbi:Mor transcription activator family protein [Pseudogracilibacillus sp. SO10305]|uniref:Mor transcription activator family protein n=1 Tax=Pseudogracilibacillus sp. SO10305 TaxID=3098292 RepID=UPI00300E15CA
MRSEIEKAENKHFNTVYRELVEIIGLEHTLKLYDFYSGQYLTFPKRVLKESYLHQRIVEEYDGTNARHLARKYDYSYSWVMKVLKRHKEGK